LKQGEPFAPGDLSTRAIADDGSTLIEKAFREVEEEL